MTLILVGNKCDLESQRQVDHKEAKEYAHSNNMMFIETSAKTALNVDQAFMETANQVYKKIMNNELDPSNDSLGVKIGTMINEDELMMLRNKFNGKDKTEC